jgi:Flp pilus assembly CpaF family ATPase
VVLIADKQQIAPLSLRLPHQSTREAIALAIDLVVHIDRKAGRRVVTEALRVSGYDARTDQFEIETVSGI